MTQKKFSESGNSPPLPPKLESLPDILTLEDVAAVLRTTRRGVYSLSRNRAQEKGDGLRFLKLPIGLRVRRIDLESWLEQAAA
jgi:Helix-turn-helix domain